jgi:hypothetical protein
LTGAGGSIGGQSGFSAGSIFWNSERKFGGYGRGNIAYTQDGFSDYPNSFEGWTCGRRDGDWYRLTWIKDRVIHW